MQGRHPGAKTFTDGFRPKIVHVCEHNPSVTVPAGRSYLQRTCVPRPTLFCGVFESCCKMMPVALRPDLASVCPVWPDGDGTDRGRRGRIDCAGTIARPSPALTGPVFQLPAWPAPMLERTPPPRAFQSGRTAFPPAPRWNVATGGLSRMQ